MYEEHQLRHHLETQIVLQAYAYITGKYIYNETLIRQKYMNIIF